MGYFIFEMDYRISFVDHVYVGLKLATDDVLAMDDATFDNFDGTYRLEEIFGVMCVVAQSYVNNEYHELKKELKSTALIDRNQAMRIFSKSVATSTTSFIELVSSLGNYYKHHEEWNGWKIDNRNKETINVLNSVGIISGEQYPCVRGAELFSGGDIRKVFDVTSKNLSDWRKGLVSHIKAQK